MLVLAFIGICLVVTLIYAVVWACWQWMKDGTSEMSEEEKNKAAMDILRESDRHSE